jgi:predicted metal-dependent HD superfamily phosphohydrolase
LRNECYLTAALYKRQRKHPEMMTHDAAIGTADRLDSLLQPWQRMAIQLHPLIGDSGFCALYSRAARLTSTRFGWLQLMQSEKTIDALLLSLRAHLASAGDAEASSANTALLSTFTKLLTGLIGEALTMQLLEAPADGSASMLVQELK